MKRNMNIFVSSIFIVAMVYCLLLCSCKKSENPAAGEKLKVATTIFPLADIARHVGRNKITVITIMPPGASPHSFEPTDDLIGQASGIKALFKIGCGLDDWGQKVTASWGGDIVTIEVSKGIQLRILDDGSVDPHYWLSLTNGSIIAKNIADELANLDPANKNYYMANLAAYQRLLVREDEEIKKKMASLQNKTFVTFHDAWFYFAQAYGLKVAESFEPIPGKEPTPKILANFIKTIRENNISVVFAEPQFSSASTQQVADELHLKVRTVDPEGGGTPETSSYIGMMRFNSDVIYKALSEK